MAPANLRTMKPYPLDPRQPDRARCWRHERGQLSLGLVVFAAAGLVYVGAVTNGFAYDDVPLIPGDPRIRTATGWLQILHTPYWPGPAGGALGIYRPLTTFSFAVDWIVSGGRPAWFHAANVLWHAVASLLVFRLLSLLVAPPGACLGALVFAVHPVHAEAVANVAGRGDVMAATFVLSACYLWARETRGRPRARTVVAVAGLYALGLFAKESAIILPALLFLVDAVQERWNLSREALARYVWRYGSALAIMVIPFCAWLAARVAALGQAAPTIVHPVAEHLVGRGDLLRTALQAWPDYLRLLLFPRTLLADYGPRILVPAMAWNTRALLGLVLLVAIMGTGALALTRGHRLVALAMLWLPIAILPVSNLIVTIGVLIAERTLYLPSVALSVAVAAAWSALRRTDARVAARWAVVATFGLALALMTARTLRRVPDWRSTETIFRALLRDRPDAYRAHWVLGRLARGKGQDALASAHYSHALGLWPYRELLVLEATTHAVARRKLHDARRLAAFAARTWPESVSANRLLAAIALDLGDTTAARDAARRGLRIEPHDRLLQGVLCAVDARRSDPAAGCKAREGAP